MNDTPAVERALFTLESHFLDMRARRVKNEVWDELTFLFVKQKRAYNQLSTTYEDVLKDLSTQIIELSDMRIGSHSDADTIAKTLSSVRGIPAFEGIFANLRMKYKLFIPS